MVRCICSLSLANKYIGQGIACGCSRGQFVYFAWTRRKSYANWEMFLIYARLDITYVDWYIMCIGYEHG